MPRLCVINVVALTPAIVRHAPRIAELGAPRPWQGPFPAVTSTSQATLLTGLSPAQHGIVANGWLYRDTGEIRFWQQSNSPIQGEKLYEGVKTAKMFWWFRERPWNGSPRQSRTTAPTAQRCSASSDATGCQLEDRVGKFPFHTFWGPRSGLPGSQCSPARRPRSCASDDPSSANPPKRFPDFRTALSVEEFRDVERGLVGLNSGKASRIMKSGPTDPM